CHRPASPAGGEGPWSSWPPPPGPRLPGTTPPVAVPSRARVSVRGPLSWSRLALVGGHVGRPDVMDARDRQHRIRGVAHRTALDRWPARRNQRVLRRVCRGVGRVVAGDARPRGGGLPRDVRALSGLTRLPEAAGRRVRAAGARVLVAVGAGPHVH